MTAPFEITDEGGAKVASNGAATLSVVDPGGRMFRRRAIKGIGGAEHQRVEWIVGELDGVRVYFDGANVVITRADLHP